MSVRGDRVNREELVLEVKKRVRNKNLFKHILAVEAIMRALARHLDQDEERWGAAGLLHDIDYEKTKDDPHAHSLLSGDIAREMGFDDEIVDAVKAHNEVHGLPRDTLMAKGLFCSDPLTGLIVAAALVSPGKSLSSIDTTFIMNRMKEKSFARGANRDIIGTCTELGFDVEGFVALGLEAMRDIQADLGL